MDYYRTRPADPTLLAATLTSALLLTLVFWLAWLWVERRPSELKMQFARCVFLLLMIVPLESVRRYWNSEGARPDVGTNIAIFAIEALLGAGLVLTLLGNLRVLRAAKRVTLFLTFLFPALMIDFGWSRLSAEPVAAYQAKSTLPMLTHPPGPRRRVIWMLFDEFDQRLAFDLRQPKVDFPEDRGAYSRSPGRYESSAADRWDGPLPALPSLLSGQIYSRAELVDANTLRVAPQSGGASNWRDQPNVFKKARELGANAEIIGWHHPYCRVFGDSTVAAPLSAGRSACRSSRRR